MDAVPTNSRTQGTRETRATQTCEEKLSCCRKNEDVGFNVDVALCTGISVGKCCYGHSDRA